MISDLAPLILAASLDLGTTEVGFHRGFGDHNLIAQSRPLMYGAKAVQVWFVDRNIVKLRRRGHPRAARVLKYGAIGLNLFAAGWNIRQIRQR